jgi:hypothetical protein
MAFQYSTTVRDATLDAIESSVGTSARLYLYTGTVPASCSVAATASSCLNVSTYTLPTSWLADASGGTKPISGVWAIAGSAAGTAGYFRIFPSSAADAYGTDASIQGTITATGGGGDMTLDNTSIAVNQVCTITSFTLTAGGA